MKLYSFTINNNKYDVLIKNLTSKKATLDLNGVEYEIEIDLIKELLPLNLSTPDLPKFKKLEHKTVSPALQNCGPLMAQIPGKVTAIFVKEGDKVSRGDKVLNLEMMKMEVPVVSPKDGIITKIYIHIGDTAYPNKPLVLIE